MAKSLEAGDGNVVRLPPRKARGAGGQKRSSKPTSRLKPKAHEEKARTRAKAEAAFKAADASIPEGVNSSTTASAPAPQPSEAEVRRAAQDRLIALHGRLKPIEGKISAAQEVLSGLKSEKIAVRGQIQQHCVPLAVYDEVRKRVDAKTKRADNELYEKQRALAFEAFGLPCGPAPELDLRAVPEAAKPAIFWTEVGYNAAVSGHFADPQRDGVPPENVQDYMTGVSDGIARTAAGLLRLAEAENGPPETPAPVFDDQAPAAASEPTPAFWQDWPEEPDQWSEAQHNQFADWFDGLGDDDDVDIDHAGAQLAFDRLNAEPEF